jgi:nucleotide-binding universal stress UspA family protein
MYANILLSTDGSDVAKTGVKHGMALAKALNARVTVITITESPMLYVPTTEDVIGWETARKEFAGKVLDEARAMAEQAGGICRTLACS